MNRIKAIQETIGEQRKVMDDLHVACEKENRSRTEEEKTSWDAAKEEIRSLEVELKDLQEYEVDQVKRAEKAEAEKRRVESAAAGTGTSNETRSKAKVYSEVKLGRAVMRSLIDGGSLDGAAAEMHAIAEEEAGVKYRGIAIPSSMIETRTDITQGTGDIKPTDVSNEYVKALRERAVYEMVGAQVHNGLMGDFKIPIVGKQAVAHVAAENTTSADGGAEYTSKTLTPFRISGYADFSNRLTLQNGEIAMRAVMSDFGYAVADTINNAMFSTATVTSAPTSLAATTSVGTFTEASYAANASILADFITGEVTIAEAEGLTGNLAYVGAPNLLADLKRSAQVASVNPAIGSSLAYNQQIINGYRTYYTTGATSSAGASGDWIFGNFQKVHVGYFGALNIIVDPVTQALTDQTRLVIHRNYDFKLMQGAAFVKATSVIA
jgi:HK97 family phage major capsid protein